MSTFFLDQGEFIGGAEWFLLDFFAHLTPSEHRQIQPVLVGGKCDEYQQKLQSGSKPIPHIPFVYPPVRGNVMQKLLHTVRLIKAAKRLKKAVSKDPGPHHFITNTPRTHFVMYLAKKLWGLQGTWSAIMHDFTTPPRILRGIGRIADHLIANAMPTRHYLHQHLTETDKAKIKIIENGLDLSTLPPARPIQEIQKILILGRIDPKKGQKYAIEAADLLLERNPELHFVVAGSSTNTDPRTLQYEKELHDFIQDRNLENVSFLGEVPDAFATMNEADLVLVLSTEPETFGRVTIEALSVGKMVLVFDQTGPREVILHYRQWLERTKGLTTQPSDFLVPPNNAMSLAEAIGALADHPEKIHPLIQHGRDYVLQNYDLQETKKRLIELTR